MINGTKEQKNVIFIFLYNTVQCMININNENYIKKLFYAESLDL